MAWFLTKHSAFGIGWDEWASIVAVLTAIAIMLRWIAKKAKTDLLGETNRQLRIMNRNLEIYNEHSKQQDTRLHKGDVKFAQQDEQLKDHEKRISRLENHG